MSGELRHRPPAPPYEETTPRGALEHHHHHDKHHLVSPHSSEGSVSDVPTKWEEFCDKTTAHGFKRYLQAHNRVSGFLWMCIIIAFAVVFIILAAYLGAKYRRREKITSISLKFDDVMFPAITFCNLNPYKRSLIRMVPSIKDTMDVYDNAKTSSKSDSDKPKYLRREQAAIAMQRVRDLFADEIQDEVEKLERAGGARHARIKRQTKRRYEAIEAHCKCVGKLDMECIRFESPPSHQDAKCVCTYDHDLQQAWPCFNQSIWYDHLCPSCTSEGYCDASLDDQDEAPLQKPQKCKCRNRTSDYEVDDKPYCISMAPQEIRKLWKPSNRTDPTTTTTTTTPATTTTTTPATTTTSTTTTTTTSTTTTTTTSTTTSTTTTTTTSTTSTSTTTTTTGTTNYHKPGQNARVYDPETLKAMGFGGMTDGVAMLTRAKENLMFTMAALSVEQRVALSYDLPEFVEMCSFNGEQCNIDTDFRRHVDPEFGNCYTFNHDVNSNFTSSRAGPMYGIRVLLFVNTSDYMSTSESSGVRLSIHSPSEYPFPDTFGYSAPVGFASSFGIKKKRVERMSEPYGDCETDRNMTGRNEYIYQGYDYHPEGCYRSCFQNALLRECGCGDPRFPVPIGKRHCSAFSSQERNCLASRVGDASNFHHATQDMENCYCKQSCKQDLFEVTFSASKWPSGATDSAAERLGDCEGMSTAECEDYYRLNAAMIEIFYEQLNYEFLQETEAYGMVNLIADFGGHLGLWMGFSVITVIEFIVLVGELGMTCFRKKEIEQGNEDRLHPIEQGKIYPNETEKEPLSAK